MLEGNTRDGGNLAIQVKSLEDVLILWLMQNHFAILCLPKPSIHGSYFNPAVVINC